jgi:regulator of replication initiation timing
MDEYDKVLMKKMEELDKKISEASKNWEKLKVPVEKAEKELNDLLSEKTKLTLESKQLYMDLTLYEHVYDKLRNKYKIIRYGGLMASNPPKVHVFVRKEDAFTILTEAKEFHF